MVRAATAFVALGATVVTGIGLLRQGEQAVAADPLPPINRTIASRVDETPQQVDIEVTFRQSRSGRGWRRESYGTNPGYGGKFVFTRIRYGSAMSAGFRRGGAWWAHDYPRADHHLSRLLKELTSIEAEVDGTNVYVLDDPDLFKYPVAYISEPGFWTMSDSEAANLRAYVLKGGFLIFDDFENEQWINLEAQLRRVFPEYRPILIDIEHPIFHSFFSLEAIYFPHPLVNVTPSYYGLFEHNDPTQRMLAIINYNNDIAEYWEWSDTGWLPIDFTNEAYKLGVNYIIYALTH